LLVANLSALRDFGGKFFDDGIPVRAHIPENRPAINQKDQKAYYNPITEKNQYKKSDLFSVPIDLKKKSIDEDADREIAERNRLAIKPKFYYDSSRKFERDPSDPITVALLNHAKDKVKRKAENYRDFLNNDKTKKEFEDRVLGKYKEYVPDHGLHVINGISRKFKNHQMIERAGKNPVGSVYAADPNLYYDASQ